MSTPGLVLGALAAVALSVALLVWTLAAPGPARLAEHRRRPAATGQSSSLSRLTGSTTRAVSTLLGRRDANGTGALERAGITLSLAEYVVITMGVGLALACAGSLVGGAPAGVIVLALVGLAAKINVSIRTGRRQRAFAEQLEDSLLLMASSLRAGHSMLQALDSVAREAEHPTAEEFARVINEVRVGRPLVDALIETADRMGSQDFVWVSQAIAINREVGGNLAEVLDGVGATIRERSQIRRQVKSLSAEGKMSAYVLMALPVGITIFISLSNPGYLAKFTESLIGYALIGLCVLMMAAGAFWLSKVTKIKF